MAGDWCNTQSEGINEIPPVLCLRTGAKGQLSPTHPVWQLFHWSCDNHISSIIIIIIGIMYNIYIYIFNEMNMIRQSGRVIRVFQMMITFITFLLI